VPLCEHTIAYDLGNYHLDEGNYDDAIDWYDRVLHNDTFKNQHKAEVYKKKGDSDSAIRCYDAVAKSKKKDVYSLSQSGILHAKTFDSLIISGTLMFAKGSGIGGGELRQMIITNGDFILAPDGLITQSFDLLNVSSNGIDGVVPWKGTLKNGTDGFGFGNGGNGAGFELWGETGQVGGNGGTGGKLGGDGGDGGKGDKGPNAGTPINGGNGGNGGHAGSGANSFTVMIFNTTINGGININGNISLSGRNGGSGGNSGSGGPPGLYCSHEFCYPSDDGNGGQSGNGGDGGAGSDIFILSTNGSVSINISDYKKELAGGMGGNGGQGGNGRVASIGGNSGNGGNSGSIIIFASTIIQYGLTSNFSNIEIMSEGGAAGTNGIGGLGANDGLSGTEGKIGIAYLNILSSDTIPPVCIGNPILFPEANSHLVLGTQIPFCYSPTNFSDNLTLINSLRHTIEIVSSNNVFGNPLLQIGESDLLNREPFNNLDFTYFSNVINETLLFRFITKDLAENVSTNIIYENPFSFIYLDVKARFSASLTNGYAPLEVQFTDLSTNVPQFWRWDFNNDGWIDSTSQNPIYTFTQKGYHTVSLTVSNNSAPGLSSLDKYVMTNYIYVSLLTNYVSVTGKHIPPFNSWENAATNITDAIDSASDYSYIIVSNGIYDIDSTISMEKSLFLKSLNGPEVTIISGQNKYRFGKYRYVKGFTLKNGTITCDNYSGTIEVHGKIQNCIICSNGYAWVQGGIVYLVNGTLDNCLVFNNRLSGNASEVATVYFGGGGAILNSTVLGSVGTFQYDGIVKNSIVDTVYGCQYDFTFYAYVNCYYSSINNFSEYSIKGTGCIQTNYFGFVDASNNNYRLLETSPCIDSGSNAYVISDWDLDGDPRINGGTVDMGAYESIPEISVSGYLSLVIGILFFVVKRKTMIKQNYEF